MPTKQTLLTLDDLFKPKDQTYLWHVPALDKDVRLRRLTHGEVSQANQDVRDAGYRVTDDLKNRLIALGMSEPAMTVEQIADAPANMDTALDELYAQIATECGFLVIQPAVERPTLYVPTPLHEEDERLLATQFTVIHEARPAQAAVDPTTAPEAIGSTSS